MDAPPSERPATQTRVYKYFALPPTANAELVREQMRAAHRYRNTLTEIERARRAAVRDLVAADPVVAAAGVAARDAEARSLEAWRVVSAARTEARAREVDPALTDALVAARKDRSAALKALGAARRQALLAARAGLDAIKEREGELVRSARGQCGAHWGSYLLVEAAAAQAKVAPLWDGTEASGPRFLRWDGTARVGVQLQGGLTTEKALGGDDTRARISPRADGTVGKPGWMTVALRVGSEGRAPVWAEWPVLMHRPLPDGATIKWATATVRMRGPHEVWSVEVTIETPAVAKVDGDRAVAVDLGWRRTDGELRVGAWRGTDGAGGEVRLGARLLERMGKPDSLRAIRDRNFNDARARLLAWIDDADPSSLPAWLADAARYMARWRGCERLGRLVVRWRTERFGGDARAFDEIEAWRRRDKHLWTWEASQRKNTLRARREVFRVAAARLAEAYDVLVLEDFDLRSMARAAPRERTERDENTRHQRGVASPSELRLVLANAFASRGKRVSYQPAAYTTRACHACGTKRTWTDPREMVHTCDGCGATWDRDDNATRNLLDAWNRERSDGAAKAGTARVVGKRGKIETNGESKWTTARRMASERRGRIGTARDMADDAAE